MRNKLTFANMLFLMLLVGKVGNIGTLGALPWLFIVLAFLLDFLLDFLGALGYYDKAVAWCLMRIRIRELIKIDKKIK